MRGPPLTSKMSRCGRDPISTGWPSINVFCLRVRDPAACGLKGAMGWHDPFAEGAGPVPRTLWPYLHRSDLLTMRHALRFRASRETP